jgi:hypothetical protein
MRNRDYSLFFSHRYTILMVKLHAHAWCVPTLPLPSGVA